MQYQNQSLEMLKNGSRYSRIVQVKYFKGCLPQILLGSFLNTLTQMLISYYDKHLK